MATLGDIPNIEYNITKGNLKALNALHIIAFGIEGIPRKTRKALRTFVGFDFDKNTPEYMTKLNDVKNQLEVADLIAVCHILNLDYTGTLDDVAERICSFLVNLDVQKNDDEEDENEDEDVDVNPTDISEDDSEESRDEDKSSVRGRRDYKRRDAFSLSFRDVEDSIRIFDGKDEYPIQKWVSDFEDIAEITGWNELQKLIFAKKSLRGLAKLFVQSEQGIKSWKILKKKLIEEFDVKLSSAQVHKMLMSKKMKKEENVQEFVLTMKEIGSRANIEPEVVIQYIIDGIQDDSANKIVLYGARNFSEFKEKVKLYETIKKKKQTNVQSGTQSTFRGRKDVKNEDLKKEKSKPDSCFNCGEKGHQSKTCPHKNKGTKCFSCNKFGHVSTKCPNKATSNQEESQPSTSANISTIEVIPTNGVKLVIDGIQLTALLDTGSDISAIRNDIYDLYFKGIPLDQTSITLKGIGVNKVKTLGSFSRDVIVNDEEATLKIHVLPTEVSNFKCIVGNDLLSQVDITVSDGQVVIHKKRKDNFLMQIKVDEYEENLNHQKNGSNIEKARRLIDSYEPKKTKTTDVKLKIILKNEEPVYHRARRLSTPEREEVDKQMEEWLKEGVVRASSSDFASALVLVKKKDGQTRICCDYRALNKKILKDRFPLPLIEDILDKLQDGQYFTTIDLRNGFFHVAVEEDSVKYTAFVTHNGQFEFLRCPFGLCNSPAVFQRFICEFFRELTSRNIAIYYMDDIIIPSPTEEEGLRRLEIVLETARDYGLEIKKEKCQLLKKRVNFLGFIVEDGKVQISEEKTAAIRKFPEPTTSKHIQSFLGLTGYFRKFIPSYALIAKPLSDLLRKEHIFKFEEHEKRSFSKLKELLSSAPVLSIYEQGRETELHTDASMHGYGACLMQKAEDGKFHPVYYTSRRTTPAEEKYHSYELEVLAVINAVKKFRIYLLGIKFKIVTDCAAFQRTMEKKDLTTRVARWALLLEEYSYEIVHRKGDRMRHVDALSRNPIIMTMIKESIMEEDGIIHRLQLAQDKDEHIQAIRKILEDNGKYEDYLFKNGLVYKYIEGKDLIMTPKSMQAEVIRRAHENGHFSVKKTDDLISREFYIPNLKVKIEKHIRNCIQCILGSRKEGKREGLLHPLSKQEGPLNTYHIDHLGPIPSTNKRYQHILAVIDDFTKFVWLYPTKSTTAKETVECLEKQQKVFGNPFRIVTDKGTAFTANEFEKYCKDEGIEHITITTGVARGNGQIERIHRVVIPVLTKLCLDDPTKWFKYIDRVQRALNSTYQRSIAKTPFEILIGVRMRNKEDVRIKELIEDEVINTFDMQREEMRAESKRQILKVQDENRKGYNSRRKKARQYKSGDLVAINRTQFGTGLKVHRKFLGPYEVTVAKPNERYDVIKVGHHEGPIRTSTCAEFMKPWIDNNSDSETDSMSDGRV